MLAAHVAITLIVFAGFLGIAAVYGAVQTLMTLRDRKRYGKSHPFREELFDRFDIGGIFVLVGLGVGLFCVAVALIPFNAKYWTYSDYQGTITEKAKLTDVASDEQLGLVVVLRLDDAQQEYITTDPRALMLEEGDSVELRCGFEWLYGGTDRLNCTLLTD